MTDKNERPEDASRSQEEDGFSQANQFRYGSVEEEQNFRRLAEDIVAREGAGQTNGLETQPGEDIQQVRLELSIHQVQLKMQCRVLQRAQDEIDSIRAHYFDLFELAPIGYCMMNWRGEVHQANLYAASLLGINRSEFIGKKMVHFIWSEDWGKYHHCLLQARQTKKLECIEVRLAKNRSTTECWAHLSIVASNEPSDTSAYKIKLVDITEQKRKEILLWASEARIREVLENASDVSYKRNLQTSAYEYLSPVFTRISGYTVDEFMALPAERVLRLIHPDDRGEINRLLVEAYSCPTNKRYYLQYRFRHKDGIYRWFLDRFIVMRNAEGLPTACIGSVSDLSEYKRSEDALIDMNHRMQAIIEATHVGTWEWNIQTGELKVNATWAKIVGYTLEELDPLSIKAWEMLSHPEDLRQSGDLLEQHFNGKIPYYDHEGRMKHKDGHWVWIHDRGQVITRTVDGKPLMMFGTHTDISQRKQWERQQRQLQKTDSLDRMVRAIAHHFNNQLGVVLGNLEMAIEDMPRDERLSKSLSGAMQGARRAAEVTSLLFTCLGQTTGIHALIDLSAICAQYLPFLQAAVAKEIIVKADLPGQGPTLRTNVIQIQQILLNLVINAGEAIGEKKGRVDLTVRVVSWVDIPSANRFPIDWQPQDLPYACLDVADNGCGIGQGDLDKLFDPFFTTKLTGRGMGLSVVLGLVKAHNGVATVESVAGQGTRIQVFFPISQVEELLPQIRSSQSLAKHACGTVLLVEDEETLRGMVTSMLIRLGYKVLAASDGVEALEMFRKHSTEIQVVLSDLSMPRMNGWELLVALNRINPGLPVILSSGHESLELFTDCDSEPPQFFLHKPYRMADLEDALIKATRSE